MDTEHENLSSEDRLLSRVVQGDAVEGDWDALEVLAARDRTVWERLAASLRAESLLAAEVGAVLEEVEKIELPAPPVRKLARLSPSFGWAAALLFAVLWGLSSRAPAPLAPAPEPAAENPDRALLHYLEAGQREGRLVQELPHQVVQTRPTADGSGLEVLYVRRLVERQVIDQFYQLGQDEIGRPTSVPVSAAQLVSYGSF